MLLARKSLITLSIVFALYIIWDWCILSTTSLEYLIPRPGDILKNLYERAPHYAEHTFATGSEIIGGIFISFFLAIPLAWCMNIYPKMRRILQPIFVTIKCIPMFTLAPLIVMWIGWSYFAILIPICLTIYFPLTLTIYKGLCATPDPVLEFFRLQKASEWQTFCKLKLPCALPYLFSGLRIAITLAGIGAIAAEWAGAQKGLGMFMMENRYNRDLEGVFGALICLICLKLTLYGLAVSLEKWIVQKRSYVFGR